MLLLLVHVDDILVTGESTEDVSQVIQDLNHRFSLKTLGSVSYFLGFEDTRTPSQLHLCQTKYATDLLQRTNMLHGQPCPTPMCQNTKLSLTDSRLFDQPSVSIGALQYLTLTRPDLTFRVNQFSQYLQAPTIAHWNAC